MKRWLLLFSFLLAAPAQGFEFLKGYDTAPSVAAAMERVRAQPQKHVLVYFGNSDHCPPCEEARAILNHKYVRDRWAPNYVVVNIDLFAPTKEEREVIGQVKVSWAPVIVFLSGNGTRVAYSRQLQSEREAMQLNEYVSQRLYAQSRLKQSLAQDFNPERMARIAAESRAVPGSGPIDDRPRVKDVLGQEHERLTGAALAKLLPGKRMHKENQDWYLTLDLRDKKLLEAEGKRKDGRGEMRGSGKWYVTKKGKLCVELDMREVDERWCRHVLRTGAGAYYVSRDLRPNRLAYRFTLR